MKEIKLNRGKIALIDSDSKFIKKTKIMKLLRKLVHLKFDLLWQSGEMSRREAYKKLAKELKIPIKKCHMRQMDELILIQTLFVLENLDKNKKET